MKAIQKPEGVENEPGKWNERVSDMMDHHVHVQKAWTNLEAKQYNVQLQMVGWSREQGGSSNRTMKLEKQENYTVF